MGLDKAAVIKATRAFRPIRYVRIYPVAFKATPLGTGPGAARFSSNKGNFETLYAASSLSTALAETLIRDRFEGGGARFLFASEVEQLCVAPVSSTAPMQLLDLRTDGCFQLGVSTDIASAKDWDEARALSQALHDETNLDGILYRSRMTAENCVAVFSRAIPTLLKAGKPEALAAMPQLPAALATLNTRLLS